MRNRKWLIFSGSAALAVLLGWSWRAAELPAQKPLPAADGKPVKVHILYTSDAVGYHEPCG
jgi:hypothetical protein